LKKFAGTVAEKKKTEIFKKKERRIEGFGGGRGVTGIRGRDGKFEEQVPKKNKRGVGKISKEKTRSS